MTFWQLSVPTCHLLPALSTLISFFLFPNLIIPLPLSLPLPPPLLIPNPKMLHRYLLLLLFSLVPLSFSSPLTCPDPTRICTSFLAFKSSQNLTLTLSMFDATLSDISTDPNSSPGYTFIRKNCSCLTSHRYFTNTTFTVLQQSPTNASDLVHKAYNGLASYNNSRFARKGMVLGVRLYCGCSSGLWNYLMSYVMEKGDTVESLSSRFGVSMDSIERANGMTGSDDGLRFGDVYYIPLNSAPGQPYAEIENSPIPAPAPAPNLYEFSATPGKNSSTSRKFPYWWVVGSMGIAVLLIAVMLLACVICKSMKDYSHASKNQSKESDLPTSHKFQILKSSSFCNTSGRYFCFKFGNSDNASATDAVNSHINIPKAVIGDALDMEKPIVFSHAEILASADYFSDANLLGHGTYGSVYYGFLQDQEVAIKKMTATKTREFIAEMKVLCKVHHCSLVELIGYAASRDELFLVYEYAQKGSLKSHLHYPQNKGQTSLSWISRVQIALDTARGLEYIHEHTKDHYVHRDIKTSNILLDNSFRAKISDFGLAKLIVATVDGEASATKVVGTIGYLAPEYLRDGLATTKSDVYAFGVVLFELISGKEAIIKTDGTAFTNSDRRSLASVMLGALKSSSESTNMASLKLHADPSLMDLYPQDCVYKMAMVAKQCVDEDPVLRPDMKQVVISLSQILLSSVEWEAALAGNSQVFSGLVQGR